jgi:hypothetical protein
MGELLEQSISLIISLESIPAGWNRCWGTLLKYVKNLKQLFTSSEIRVQTL